MKFIMLFFLIYITTSIPLSAQVTGLSGWNIFLDPGHSQKENMGIYNYSEAEKNLGVALYLRDMLLTMTDIDTVHISRTNDTQKVLINQRTDYANQLGAAWYHSIHSDAGDPNINSTLLLWGQYYNGNEKNPPGGKKLGDIMVQKLTKGMRTITRGSIGDCSYYTWSDWCQRSGGPYLHVNRETNMPSELSEAGHHTNPAQNQRNMNAEWKKLEAKTMFWSILELFDITPPAEGICTGYVSDIETGTPVNGARVHINGQTYTTDTYESLFHKYSTDPDQLSNGFYYIENLPHETLSIIVEAENYRPDTSEVTVLDSFFTFKDISLVSKITPYIRSSVPVNGDTSFQPGERIIIQFSRMMDINTVNSAVSISPPRQMELSWSNQNMRLTIRADSLDFESNYTLTIPGSVKDIYGHPLDGNRDGVGGDDFVLAFKTAAEDMAAPQIVDIYPPPFTQQIDRRQIIKFTYDEEIDLASLSRDKFKFARLSDNAIVPGTLKHYVVNRQSVICFFPAEMLLPQEQYDIRVYPGFRDYSGNTVTDEIAFQYTTNNIDYETITSIDNFESGIDNWWKPQQSGSTTGIITDSTNTARYAGIVNVLTGSASAMKFNYGWDSGASSPLIRLYLSDGTAAKSVHFNSSFILQAYIFGDGSGNAFRFCVDDRVPNSATGNHEVSPWFTIDWLGWKPVSWDMATDETGEWLGDGNLDGILRFDSIQFTRQTNGAKSGVIYIDDLRIVKTSNEIQVIYEPVSHPDTHALLRNYPNPFNPVTTIRYQLSGGSHHVRLTVYDILGKQVRTLVDAIQSAGYYQTIWDGKDDHGNSVVSGTYLCKLSAGQFSQARRMMLMK